MTLPEQVEKAPHLQLGVDELYQMFALAYLPSAQDLLALKYKITDLHIALSNKFASYQRVISLNQIDNKDKEIESLVYETNLSDGKCLFTFIELLCLSGIGFNDVKNYYESLLVNLKLDDAYFFADNMSKTCTAYARHNNIQDHLYNNPEINLRPRHLPGEVNESFILSNRIFDIVLLDILAKDLWKIMLHLGNALNNIKDSKKYQIELMESFLRLFKSFDMVGHNADSTGRVFSVYNFIINQNETKK